jgi:glycosyltransferase involved in cell wall biosynthesis
MPKVSIITSCYNAEKYVAKAMESVREQTFTDWEYVVIDDGSTDGSAQIIESYLEIEPRLRFGRQANGGMCNARNNGFKACSASSTYVLFFDADDFLEPQMVEVMVKYLDEHPGVGVAYCDHWNIDADDRVSERDYFLQRYVPSRFGVRSLPYDTPETPLVAIAGGLGASLDGRSLFRRSIYEKTSGWDEQLGRGGQVLDLFAQVALVSDIHFVAQKLHRYRLHNDSQSHRTVNYQAQSEKILNKWKEGEWLSAEQKAKMAELLWFYEKRFKPYMEIRNGTGLMRQGQIGGALRLYLGAAKKYFTSFLPMTH